MKRWSVTIGERRYVVDAENKESASAEAYKKAQRDIIVCEVEPDTTECPTCPDGLARNGNRRCAWCDYF